MITPVDVALAELQHGVAQYHGERHNQRILEYLRTTGLTDVGDETPWCSAFVNWCCIQAWTPGTNLANARSWLNWGRNTIQGDARMGDVVVLWRGERTGWKGHVLFYLDQRDGWITGVGGNQGNRVSVQSYSSDRLLEIRRAA